MTPFETKPDPQSEDMTLPGACATCGGDLVVRVAPGTSAGYCHSCHSISRPLLRFVRGAVQVAHPVRGAA